METMYTGIKFIFYIQPLTGGLHLENDALHFLFDAYVFFVNTDNMHLITKASCMSYYKM